VSGNLNHSQAKIIAKLIIDLGHGITPVVGSTTEWQVYSSHEPDSPTNAITVYDTAGRQAGRLFNGETQAMNGFQLRIRSDLQTDGRGKIEDIKEAFDKDVKRAVVHVGESWYVVHSIARTTEIIPLGVDSATRRRTWTLNAVTAIRLYSTTGTGTPVPP